MKQTVEEAAREARISSAESLTTFGMHQSLDDFTGMDLSRDELAESETTLMFDSESDALNVCKGYMFLA